MLSCPVAAHTSYLTLTFATFIGVFAATKLEPRVGAADGKRMVRLGGFSPLALAAGAIIQVLLFLWARLRTGRPAPLPGAAGFYLGAVLCASLLAMNVR